MTAKNDERCVPQSDSAVFFEYKLWYNTRVKRLFENQFCLRGAENTAICAGASQIALMAE